MKALGEAAVDLPWIMPCAGSLVGLTRTDAAAVWSEVRFDPGCVLLVARFAETSSFPALLKDSRIIDRALSWLSQPDGPGAGRFVDWNLPGAASIYRACSRQALAAEKIAVKVSCSAERAFVAALLAPLGWLALAAVTSERMARFVEQARLGSSWQQSAWGLDHTAITRRLGRLWRLPAWLTAVIGNLGLHVSIVERLGAEPVLFRVVQLAVALTQESDGGLPLALGDDAESLRLALGLSIQDVDEIAMNAPPAPIRHWDAPAQQPYLHDLLRLALANRQQEGAMFIRELQAELDQLQNALQEHCRGEKERLQAMKLSALAELAAGAGHEINNPLAVISGQAQYLLKQLQVAEDMLAEQTSPTALLDGIKNKFSRPLQTIVSQAQRIHLVLTDLMHFAKPPAPHPQLVPAGRILQEVSESLQEVARQKRVRLVCDDPPKHWGLRVDIAQVRTALGGMLRNAIEAAPADGWAGLRVENGDGTLKLIVEDNGPGPASGNLEHLFDPFYSGRTAGRGRGFGLASAWRLARQQGGEVRFDGRHEDVTRFVLTLPAADISVPPALLSAGGDAQVFDANTLSGSTRVA
jgi:signal transduction histidine kinase